MKFLKIIFIIFVFCTSWAFAITPQNWEPKTPKTATCQVLADGTLSITGNTKNNIASFFSEPIALPKDKIYTLLFSVRGDISGGRILAGTRYINKDIAITQEAGFVDEKVRIVPINDKLQVKLGVWNSEETALQFKNIRIAEYLPLFDNQNIASVETIKNGIYENCTNLNLGYPTSPSPINHNTIFNTNRWSINGNSALEFTFGNNLVAQENAKIQLSVSYNPSKINIEIYASADDKPYQFVGKIGAINTSEIELPANIFPAKFVKIKLNPDSPKDNIQITSMLYRAEVDNKKLELSARQIGSADITISDDFDVVKQTWNANSSKLKIASKTTLQKNLKVYFYAESLDKSFKNLAKNVAICDNGKAIELKLPVKLADVVSLKISIPEKNWELNYSAEKSNFTLLENDFFGKRLTTNLNDITLWQTPSANKLALTCKAPKNNTNAIKISCANNESETLQLVFASKTESKIDFQISDLVNQNNNTFSAKNIEPFLLEYVQIEHCSDYFGKRGFWPDPTVKLTHNNINLSTEKITPLWIKFTVPQGTPAGVYRGKLTISKDGGTSQIPVELRVFGFALPQKPTLRSAFGISSFQASRYFKNPKKVSKRIESDLQNALAQAKISPYNSVIASPDFKFVYPDNDKTKTPEVVFDWTRFDNDVSEQIQKNNVNAMCIKIQGIGGGNFRRHIPGKIKEIADGDPRFDSVLADYLGQIDKHIVAKGWQNLFYTYTFDEPEKHNYPFVIKELQKIKKHAPHLKIMLTEQPVKELAGLVDIWCPISNEFSYKFASERKKLGDEIWWYICTNPRAPYACLFIDHAGVDLRTWLWQTFKYDIDGILIWSTTFTHSATAYPNTLQNPYQDPMSWADVYVLPRGTKRAWGNGDGRFFYPPISTKDGSKADDNAQMVGTMRLDILRDGIEDYEYLKILQRTLAEKSHKLSPQEKEKYTQLLVVPDTITKSLTEFSFNPTHIEIQREQIGSAIEELIKK